MKKFAAFALLALSGAGVLTVGCESGARIIEQDRSITTVDQIDIQDFRSAAASLTREMIDSPRWTSTVSRIKGQLPAGALPLMRISRIKNDTMLKVDMRGFLIDPMENELLKTDLVDFYAEDAEAQDLAQMSGTQPRLPNLVLYGTVRDLRSEAGDVKQASYVFHLKLADATGLTIWQGEKLITKQGTKPAVGI